MIASEVADVLERFASAVTRLPGVSRTNPHVFAESKSELAGEMVRMAKELRTVRRTDAERGVIRPGTRTIETRTGHREVRVETRRRA